jgi:hypothetical protein
MTSRLVLGTLLAVNIGLLLGALSFANVSTEGPAKRALAHSVAILIEVDSYLDEHYAALEAEASGAPPAERIVPPELPVDVSLTAGEVSGTSREEFRALLLERLGERVWDDGENAWRPAEAPDPDQFSPAGAVEASMELLRPPAHRVFLIATIVLAATAAALFLALALAARDDAPLIIASLPLAFSSILFLLVALLVMFALGQGSGGASDYLPSEYMELAQTLSGAAIRNSIVFVVGAGALIAAGFALSAWSGHQRRDIMRDYRTPLST